MFFSREQEAQELQRRLEESGKRLLESLAQLDQPIAEPEHAKPRVVLISSDFFERASLVQSLSHEFDILVAEDIHMCLAYIADRQPYAILIDDKRKDPLDAVEVVESLKQVVNIRQVPLVYIDSNLDVNKRFALLRAGVTDYLAKPLDYVSLIRRLHILPRMAQMIIMEPS